MAGKFLEIDINFPTFTGEENEKELITGMLNYLRQLVDQLRFTLNNLDQTNFNKAALDEISTGSAGNIAEQVQTLASQLNQTNGRVATLISRMNIAEGDITDLQGAVQIDPDTGDITIGDGTVQVDLSGGTVNINGEETDIASILQELSEHSDSIDALAGAVQVDENTGDITIGDTGIQVDINGDVYINGAPQ